MKIGLVLGGGFAKGSAQAGFMKGLSEYLDPSEICLISASSIGAINGIAYSNGNMQAMENIYRTTNITSIKNLRIDLKNKIVDDIVNTLTKENELKIPMYVTGLSLGTLSTHYFYVDANTSNEELHDISNVAVTFPFVNGICKKKFGRLYIDGGGTDNIPTLPFMTHKVDLLLILHSYTKYLPPMDLVYDSGAVVIDVDVTAKCDDTIATYSFRNDNLINMFESGYKYGQEFGQRVFKDRDLEQIKLRGQEFIREGLELRRPRKSTLTVAVFFNKVMQTRSLR
ncbi:MAG: patatin-like phospholipase family protein [Acholeplasmatales bacterium]|nr:patatin-like phospholipase family protein [Acholeplasmatales bacterium]